MKRPSIRMMESSTSELSSDEELGSSLKRVRISTSPGELRLERDFTQLGWTPSNKWLSPDIYMDRVHALQLVIYLQGNNKGKGCKLHIDIPRLYPHSPPKIVHIEGGEGTLLKETEYAWTPVMTLQDFISQVWQTYQQQQTPDEEERSMPVDAITDLPAKHVTLFAPNRFNLGYDQSATTACTTTAAVRAMEW